MLLIKFGFDWAAVSEKIFEYYGNLHVYSPKVGADQLVPLSKASKLQTEHLIIGYLLRFYSPQEKWFKSNICINL